MTRKDFADEGDDTHMCIKCKIIICGLDNYVLHRKETCQVINREADSQPSNNVESLLSFQGKGQFQTIENNGVLSHLPAVDRIKCTETGKEPHYMPSILKTHMLEELNPTQNEDEMRQTQKHKEPYYLHSEPQLSLTHTNILKRWDMCKISNNGEAGQIPNLMKVDQTQNEVNQSIEEELDETKYSDKLGIDKISETIQIPIDNCEALVEAPKNASSFFQSLELQNNKEKETDLRVKTVDDQTFFESIGLYWTNPAEKYVNALTNTENCSSVKENKDESVDMNVPGLATGNEEMDFLQVLGLTPVGDVAGSKKWKLWNPEEGLSSEWTEKLLGSDLYLPETAYTDPILMEDQVNCMSTEQCLNSNDQFYCSQCNRNLTTEELYRRHLQSELHFKNSLPTLEESTNSREKRTIKRPKFFDEDNSLHGQSKSVDKDKTLFSFSEDNGIDTKDLLIKELNKSKIPGIRINRCQTCDATIFPNQYGKHLISHYHFHRSLGHPDNQKIILSNIAEIIKQSPFQCGSCSFYCNWHSDLINHVRGHEKKTGGNYWCQVCMKIIGSHVELERHLKSYNHTELVSVINRSVPVVIRNIELVSCGECNREFRFNLGLKKHMQIAHNKSDFQLEDQPIFRCKLCTYFSHKKSSLKTHQFLVHPNTKLKYDCYLCKVQFTSKESALRHRNSGCHKFTSLNHCKVSDDKPESKNCSYCNELFYDFDKLTKHLEERHFEHLSQCHICGELFHFPQSVPAHIKLKCKNKSGILKKDGCMKCNDCSFSTDKEDIKNLHDMFAHSNIKKYVDLACPTCNKIVKREKLKKHLRKHVYVDKKGKSKTSNIPEESMITNKFQCTLCSYTSQKRALLNLHIKRQHQIIYTHICDICNAIYKLKSSLQNHQKSHHPPNEEETVFKCEEKNCIFTAKYKCDMERHISKHSSEKNIFCNDCNFQCKRKSELTRHRKFVHDKIPFLNCKQCEYKTKNNCHMKRHSKVHNEKVEYMEVYLDENDQVVDKQELALPPEFVTEQVI